MAGAARRQPWVEIRLTAPMSWGDIVFMMNNRWDLLMQVQRAVTEPPPPERGLPTGGVGPELLDIEEACFQLRGL